MDSPAAPDTSPEQQALQAALAGLMASVAQLAVARGTPYGAVEEMLRLAFVQAAARAHPGLPEHRKVSRISTTTGLNRREVARLVQSQLAGTPQPPRSLASEVFTHWRTQPPYMAADGQPKVLPRLGAEPSFETLAQFVTRNVHPRSLLDELCRLGLARWDMVEDTVALARDFFVASGDVVGQLGFLRDNVGDHLSAAVANVLSGDGLAHFEQAMYADGLSAEAIQSMIPEVRAQWEQLLKALVPKLEARVQAGSQLNPEPQGRIRIGMYSFHEGAVPPPTQPERAAPARVTRKK